MGKSILFVIFAAIVVAVLIPVGAVMIELNKFLFMIMSDLFNRPMAYLACFAMDFVGVTLALGVFTGASKNRSASPTS